MGADFGGISYGRRQRHGRSERAAAPEAGEGWRGGRDRIGRDRRSPALCLEGQEKAQALGSSAAVPFFEPHQLIVIAVGRIGGVKLRFEFSAAVQIIASN